MMGDIPESHLAFARELVALARKHGMNNLDVRFDHRGDRVDWATPLRDAKTTFTWAEGRHGAKMNIYMVREESVRFEEVEPQP